MLAKRKSCSSSDTSKKKAKGNNTFSLEPVLMLNASDPPPTTLILGTHPSVKSLEHNQNYGHKNNSFWNIFASTVESEHIQRELSSESYEKLTKAFTKAGNCLWDVVKECSRQGSLDSNIKSSYKVNDIFGLLKKYKSIKRVCFAKTATTFFKKGFADHLKGKYGWRFYINEDSPCFDSTKSVFAKPAYKAVRICKANENKTKEIELVVCPSTSPASAKMRPAYKEKVWHTGVYGFVDKPQQCYYCPCCKTPNSNHWAIDCNCYTEWRASKKKISSSKDLEDYYRWLF